MFTRLRTICVGAALLLALAACGGSTPAETTPGIPTAVTNEGQTAYPAPTSVIPTDMTAYPGEASDAPLDVPSAYPGVTVTP